MAFHLPLLMKNHVVGKRSAVTCALKCANQCMNPVCNTSDAAYFGDIARAAISRRALLGGTAAGALVMAIGGAGKNAPQAFADANTSPNAFIANAPKAPGGSPMRFTPIKPVPHTEDSFVVPEGYRWQPIIRWGDPLFADSPAFDWHAQSYEAQTRQFGYNNDYTEILEVPGQEDTRAVLFINHEYTNPNAMFPETMPIADQVAITMAAQGLSVVELERKDRTSPYTYIQGAPLNRRFLLTTEYELTGPAAGSDLVKTVDDPTGTKILGTFANCAGGLTPWGTLLTGEENFHGYFSADSSIPGNKRLGLKEHDETTYRWEIHAPRFNTLNPGYENEANRFGYIVEVDPWDPTSTPRKHSMLGRFKHEGANIIIAEDGRAVAYTGDDERFEYIYKFVSKNKYIEGNRAHNMTLLTEGSLYVARFTGNSPVAEIDGSGKLPSDGAFDGAGEWLPLIIDGVSQIPGMSAAEVCVNTRLAADTLNPTKMDRPEDVEASQRSRRVYAALTNNSNRGKDANYAGADEANPRAINRDGHVIEIDELGNQTGTRFAWNLLLVAGDPAQGDQTFFGGFPVDQVSPISCPDNLAFDAHGNLWISTDGAPNGIGYNDGLFRVTLEGENRGYVEQFLSVPQDAETCGPVIRDRDFTAFVSVQHPGENGTFSAPRSYFPDYNGTGPRPTVVQVLAVRDSSAEKPVPSPQPTQAPIPSPSTSPSAQPSVQRTQQPTVQPSVAPSAQPSASAAPSVAPSAQPTGSASVVPSAQATASASASGAAAPVASASSSPASATGGSGKLAHTGADVAALAVGATALLGAGGAVVAHAAKSRRAEHAESGAPGDASDGADADLS